MKLSSCRSNRRRRSGDCAAHSLDQRVVAAAAHGADLALLDFHGGAVGVDALMVEPVDTPIAELVKKPAEWAFARSAGREGATGRWTCRT